MRQQTIRVGPAQLPIKILSSRGRTTRKVVFTWAWKTTPELCDPAIPFDWRYESPVCLTGVAIEFLRHKWFNAIIRQLQEGGDEFSYYAVPSKGRISVPRSLAPQIKTLIREVLAWPESWKSYAAVSVGGVPIERQYF